MDSESVNTQSSINVGSVGSPVETDECVDNNFEVNNHFVSISFFKDSVGSGSSSSSGCCDKRVSVGSSIRVGISGIREEIVDSGTIDWT